MLKFSRNQNTEKCDLKYLVYTTYEKYAIVCNYRQLCTLKDRTKISVFCGIV